MDSTNTEVCLSLRTLTCAAVASYVQHDFRASFRKSQCLFFPLQLLLLFQGEVQGPFQHLNECAALLVAGWQDSNLHPLFIVNWGDDCPLIRTVALVL